MIRVGIAGIGFMGWIHWLAYQRTPGVEVVAICSRDPAKRSGDWTSIKGNFGPSGTQVDLSGIAAFESLDDMLIADDIDCVDICLPPDQHLIAAVSTANAGKHVFCEKPLALNVEDCDAILEACQENQVQLLVGHVLPFFPEYRWAREQIDSGQYGQLIGGQFKRIISNPDWIPDFFNPGKVGGPLIDLHVHDAHLIRILFGMPHRLYCRGRTRGDSVEYATTAFDFADPRIVVGSLMGVVHQPARPFTHGFEIHLEDATIQFEFAGFSDNGETMPVKLIDRSGNIVRPELGNFDPIDGFAAELLEVVMAIINGIPSPLLSGAIARDAIHLCQLQSRSCQENAVVSVN
jgi:predicted dehydrogenase